MLRKITIILSFIWVCTEISAQTAETEWLHDLNAQTSMHGFSKVMSTSAYVVSVATPLTQGIVALATKNDALLKDAISTTVGLGITTTLVYGLKYTIRRPRPYETYPDYIQNVATEGLFSFPSGHTSIAFSTVTSLSLQYPKWYVIVPGYVWACGVGYSRMNLGVHYPSDVLAGAALGAGSAVASHYLNRWMWRKLNNKKLIGLQVYEHPLAIESNL